ncbi:MAG: hypothetical protein D6778_06455, partial [Nitrospirae bacterium]
PLRFVLFGAGFWSMALMVTVLLLFQGYHGVLYEKIGLLNGLFMFGLWIGAELPGRVSWLKTKRAIFLSILLAICIGPFVMALKAEGAFYLFCLVSGMVTGVQFGLSSEFNLKDAPGLYGMELLGSSLAAITVGVFGVGLYGVGYVVAGIMGLEALALVRILK